MLLFLRVKERADCIVLEENSILLSALLYIIETFFSHLLEFVSSGFSICLNMMVSIYFFICFSKLHFQERQLGAWLISTATG